jgi:predicted RNase H-like HicB family nuclease
MKHRYHMNVFWSEPGGRWVADVPDLRGCSAHGATPEEAVGEAETAIELWIETAREEGLPIPEPAYRPSPPKDCTDKEAA